MFERKTQSRRLRARAEQQEFLKQGPVRPRHRQMPQPRQRKLQNVLAFVGGMSVKCHLKIFVQITRLACRGASKMKVAQAPRPDRLQTRWERADAGLRVIDAKLKLRERLLQNGECLLGFV